MRVSTSFTLGSGMFGKIDVLKGFGNLHGIEITDAENVHPAHQMENGCAEQPYISKNSHSCEHNSSLIRAPYNVLLSLKKLDFHLSVAINAE